MSPELEEAAARGRERARAACAGARGVRAIDDRLEREERARRCAEARLRWAALGLFDRPDTTWEGQGLDPAQPELPLRGLRGATA